MALIPDPMAKRFTATEKWDDPWFMGLSLEGKIVWQLLCDRCDAVGVWEPNKPLVNFLLKRDVEWDSVLSELTTCHHGEFPRVEVLENGKWFLTRFIAFQYGKLSEECFPHRKIMELVVKHGLEKHEALVGLLTSTLPTRVVGRVVKKKEVPTTLPGRVAATQQDKDKEEDKDSDRIGGAGGKETQGELLPTQNGHSRNPIIDALASLETPNLSEVTDWPRHATALKLIRSVSPNVDSAEISRRGANYQTHFQDCALTSNALAKHWGTCAVPKRTSTPIMR